MKYQGIGISSYMMELIIGIIEGIKQDIGIRYISVDAYDTDNAINFYSYHNFEVLKKAKNRKQIPMYWDTEFREDDL